MPSHPARTLSRPTGRGSKTTYQLPICAYSYNHMMPSDGAGRIFQTSVNWVSLLRLLAVSRRIGAQPQRHVGWLHRLPYHPYQVVAQGIQVRLISELGGECF